MTEDDIADRLAAVERRLDAAYPEPQDGIDPERVEAVAERVADVEAAVEAIEGYVGEIQREDGELERRADAALAATDDLEARVEELEERVASANERASANECATAAAAGVGGEAAATDEPEDAFATPTAGTVESVGVGQAFAPSPEPTASRSPAGGAATDTPDGTAGDGRERESHSVSEPTDRTGAWPLADETADSARAPAQQSAARPTRSDPERSPSDPDRARNGRASAASGAGDAAVSGWGADPSRTPRPDTAERRQSVGARERGSASDAPTREWDPSSSGATGDEPGQTLFERLRELL